MHGPGHVLHVGGVEAAHVDAARLQQVDVVLLHQVLGLPLRQPRVREQPDLLHDVVPAARGAQSAGILRLHLDKYESYFNNPKTQF